ncbi:hypothetical protein K449DRAFT_445058 [Hypoxylon sp. EC38]|nr:hypothetical protein K449DRAFT_445058 [Hypoxylon sp. EC38]
MYHDVYVHNALNNQNAFLSSKRSPFLLLPFLLHPSFHIGHPTTITAITASPSSPPPTASFKMADRKATDKSSSGKQPGDKKPGSKQPRFSPDEMNQALDEINRSVAPSQQGLLSGKKRRREPEPVRALAPAPSVDLSGRVVAASPDQVQYRFRKNRLVDIEDLHPNKAPNLIVSGRAYMHGRFDEGDVLEEHAINLWKTQNNGRVPPTLISLTRINRGNRTSAQAKVGTHYRRGISGEDAVDYYGEDEEAPAPAPAPLPPALEPAKKKRRRNKRNRQRNRRPFPGSRSDAPAAGGYAETEDAYEEERLEDENGGHSKEPATISSVNLPPAAPSRAPAPTSTPLACANCGKTTHLLSRCPGPVDKEGFVPGCVLHNSMEHSYDECPAALFNTPGQHFANLVLARAGLPPVRTIHSWPKIAMAVDMARLKTYPLRCATSLGLSQSAIDGYDFGPSAPVNQLADDLLTNSYDAVSQNINLLGASEKVRLLEAPPQDKEDEIDYETGSVFGEDTVMH